jgi:hypothetical protein
MNSGPKGAEKLLAQILRDGEYKLLRLKLCDLNLNESKIIPEIIEILHANYGIITYLNLSNTNI